MKRVAACLILMALVLAIAPSPAAVQGQSTPTFEFADCPFDVPDDAAIECGYLMVPEDRADPGSQTIYLAVAILRSYSANPQPDPVVYLEGGPGGSALIAAIDWLESPILENRDLILIDQRGTGYSEPFLGCPYPEETDSELLDDVTLAADCAAAFTAEGIDLSDYNSATNAADVNDLRLALGIEEWNVYGISYGTRLALTVMRDYPEGVRTVVLDSVYPPEVRGYEEQPFNAYLAFAALFEDCAADANCSAAFPDLETVFYATIDRLNENPVEVQDPYGDIYEYDGTMLVNDLFNLMYDAQTMPYLPLMIDEISRDQFDTYFWLMFGSIEEYVAELADSLDAMPEDGLYDLLDSWGFDSVEDLQALLPEMPLEDLDLLNDDIYLYSIPYDEYDAAIMAYLEVDDVDEMYDLIDEMSDEDYFIMIDEVFFSHYLIGDSDGMFNSVECVEEIPFNSVDGAIAVAEAGGMPQNLLEILVYDVEAQIEVCGAWGVTPAAAFENEPVQSDIPTLIVAGEYDPITPPAWGQSAANHLTRHYFYVYPGLGHGVTLDECPLVMMVDFLDDPASAPDDSCLQAMGNPVFELP